jgi:hypothetical protein
MRGDNTEAFCVRGVHPSFYAVDFPDWLPDDIVQKMVDIIEGYFLIDLEKAISFKKESTGRQRTLSMHSYLSTQSNAKWEAPAAKLMATFKLPSA